MARGLFELPKPYNEPFLGYAPGSKEREEVLAAIQEMTSTQIDAPLFIGGDEIMTEEKKPLSPPHNHQHILGHAAWANEGHVRQAIDSALKAQEAWEKTSWEHRASIFLKAAELIAGPYRARFNAATMLSQSKNIHQAEIDAVAELVDFLRFNVSYMEQIYKEQPHSPHGMWNRVEYRPLEGFVFCITPFNFTAIAGNLPTAPAMLGNVCVWKPADSQIYSARLTMEIFKEAGMPDGVINLIYGDGPMMGNIIFDHPDFAGLHFTGSTNTFQALWKIIGQNIHKYRSYPRIVGETGGKDYILAHPTANPIQVATAMVRGAFEFQGQKCSAASRVYLPASIYDATMDKLIEEVKTLKMGDPADFTNFINAVIDERAFDKIAGYIDQVKASDNAYIVQGGGYDKSKGYFIEPTIVVTNDPKSLTMQEEIFGPVLTIYKYDDYRWEETLDLINSTSPYALTGAIFCKDRYLIEDAMWKLRNTAGNFYINDKPTGSVVGQQPFGGARGSGTNDKAGSYMNLLRWASARTIKETFVPPTDYRYDWHKEG
ncbi:MAG: L-glutamate gamma-semialdehyde dehydrogenase [Bacteroidia bacterium]|nr:L-glutamate gamma-semialdehyde dehydrogenase [Bacteroidia bacterium]